MSQIGIAQSTRRDVASKLLRASIAIVGLLIVRVVVGYLPMIGDADPIVLGFSLAPPEMASAASQPQTWISLSQIFNGPGCEGLNNAPAVNQLSQNAAEIAIPAGYQELAYQCQELDQLRSTNPALSAEFAKDRNLQAALTQLLQGYAVLGAHLANVSEWSGAEISSALDRQQASLDTLSNDALMKAVADTRAAVASAANFAGASIPRRSMRQVLEASFPSLDFILPADIADAIIDTLIFLVLIYAAFDFSRMIENKYPRLPSAGKMLILGTLVVVVAVAYGSYGRLVRPVLGNAREYYAWFFLFLGLLPFVGIIFLAYRDLDRITDIAFSSSESAIKRARVPAAQLPKCASCGQPLEQNAKFCGSCGAAAATATPPPVYCSACGTKNEGGAAKCVSCGKSLVSIA